MSVNLLHVLFIGPLLIYIGIFKPQKEIFYHILLGLGILVLFKFTYLTLTQKLTQRSVWYILHVILFSMIAVYVGVNKQQTIQIGYSLLLATGLSAFWYHLIRLFGVR